MKRIIITLLAVLTLSSVRAQEAVEQPVVVSVVESLTADSLVILNMDSRLIERLMPDFKFPSTGESQHANVGYRVQVFSDNNSKTARDEARRKEQLVAARFPQYRTYKKYTAPYWRVRVGDFRTQSEAQEAASAIQSAFSSFRREIRVVRDRINITR